MPTCIPYCISIALHAYLHTLLYVMLGYLLCVYVLISAHYVVIVYVLHVNVGAIPPGPWSISKAADACMWLSPCRAFPVSPIGAISA